MRLGFLRTGSESSPGTLHRGVSEPGWQRPPVCQTFLGVEALLPLSPAEPDWSLVSSCPTLSWMRRHRQERKEMENAGVSGWEGGLGSAEQQRERWASW